MYFEGLDDHRVDKKVRVFYDEEEKLIGLYPDKSGYVFNHEKISIRTLPEGLPLGRFVAEWDEEQNMVIVDLNKPITIS